MAPNEQKMTLNAPNYCLITPNELCMHFCTIFYVFLKYFAHLGQNYINNIAK